MLNPDVPIEELKLAYTNWRETKGGNLDQVLGLFDDRIEMHSVLEPNVQHELARVQHSREDTKSYFRELLDNWEMIDFPTERIRCHWRNKLDGKEIDTPKIDVWTFRNGKAVRFFEMFDSLGFARAASLI